MVVEAVFESLAVKRQIFTQLEAICPASTLLCSNTSALDIDEIAAAASTRPHMVMGMHFFSPANVTCHPTPPEQAPPLPYSLQPLSPPPPHPTPLPPASLQPPSSLRSAPLTR